MKKYLYGTLLAFICFVTPLQAQSTSTQPSIHLNQLSYTPIHQPKIIDKALYLSIEDLASLTYSTYETLEDGGVFTIQNTPITYEFEERTVKVNHTNRVLNTPIYSLDGITYLPVTILSLVDCPYTLSEDQLTFNVTPLMPYSMNQDDTSSHTLLSTDYENFYDILGSILPKNKVNQLVRQSESKEAYISIMSTAYKKECLEAMRELMHTYDRENTEFKVHIRQLDCMQTAPVLSSFITYPIQYNVSTSGLSLTLGNESYTNPFLWATYNPNASSPTSIDINKSLDAMMMRSLYAYFRTQHDLKDDLDTLPIYTIQRGTSDQMRYNVYLDNDNANDRYQVVLYRTTNANTIEYYVDFMPV